MKVYLSGLIIGLPENEAITWRKYVADKLGEKFTCLCPMRYKFDDSDSHSRNEIVSLDKKDIIDCDIVLVNAEKTSWGTGMEIMFGYIHHKIIVTYNSDPEKLSPWVWFHSTKVLKNVDEAIEYVRTVSRNGR